MNKTELFTKEELVDIIYKSMCDKDNLINKGLKGCFVPSYYPECTELLPWKGCFVPSYIKYLEDKITNQDIENETEYGHARDVGMYFAYQDILERVKSGKYEWRNRKIPK